MPTPATSCPRPNRPRSYRRSFDLGCCFGVGFGSGLGVDCDCGVTSGFAGGRGKHTRFGDDTVEPRPRLQLALGFLERLFAPRGRLGPRVGPPFSVGCEYESDASSPPPRSNLPPPNRLLFLPLLPLIFFPSSPSQLSSPPPPSSLNVIILFHRRCTDLPTPSSPARHARSSPCLCLFAGCCWEGSVFVTVARLAGQDRTGQDRTGQDSAWRSKGGVDGEKRLRGPCDKTGLRLVKTMFGKVFYSVVGMLWLCRRLPTLRLPCLVLSKHRVGV